MIYVACNKVARAQEYISATFKRKVSGILKRKQGKSSKVTAMSTYFTSLINKKRAKGG
jgi:hypothetical protein